MSRPGAQTIVKATNVVMLPQAVGTTNGTLEPLPLRKMGSAERSDYFCILRGLQSILRMPPEMRSKQLEKLNWAVINIRLGF